MERDICPDDGSLEKILSDYEDAKGRGALEHIRILRKAEVPRRAMEKALQDKIVSIYPHLKNRVMVHLGDFANDGETD